MEIKKIEKNIANYPKKNEIEKSEIKKATPKKWIFSGMLLSVVDLVGGKVLATEISRTPPVIAGGFQVVDPTGMIVGVFVTIIELISFVLLILGTVSIICKKIKAKRKAEEYKVSRKQKIFVIVSLVLVTLSFIAEIIYHLGEEITV